MSKKQTNDKPTRRRRKVIIEKDERVVAWCKLFIGAVKAERGYEPTMDQAQLAFLNDAFKALGDPLEETDVNCTVTFDASEATR